MTRQRGLTLIELLVALPVVALLGAVLVHLLLAVHRSTRADDGAVSAERELRHGAHVLAEELRTVQARDLVTWSDTSVEFNATVGVGIVCNSTPAAAGTASLALAGAASATSVGVPLTPQWNQPPQPGDRVVAWAAPMSTTPGGSADAVTRIPDQVELHVRAVTVGAVCAGSPLAAASSGTLVAVSDALARPLRSGSPVRISRRVRYSLYRGSDREWYLGRRSLGPSGWDVIQPVIGPLSAAHQRGLVVTVFDSTGATLGVAPTDSVYATGGPRAARIRLQLRAPRRAGRSAPRVVGTDSIITDVALRADRGGGA